MLLAAAVPASQTLRQPNYFASALPKSFAAFFSNASDHRVRQQEFDQTEKISIEDLKQRLQKLASDLNECFDSITEQALLDNYEVQCFRYSNCDFHFL